MMYTISQILSIVNHRALDEIRLPYYKFAQNSISLISDSFVFKTACFLPSFTI